MSTAYDPNSMGGFDMPNPDAISAQQQEETAAGMSSPWRGARNFALGSLLGRTLIGNPRLERAQSLQQSVGNSLSDSDANAPSNEDGLDSQIRRLKATYLAVADKSPQAALQISNKLGILQEAQNQQKKLSAQTDAETARTNLSNDKDILELAQKGTRVVGNAQTGQQYGSVRMFDESGKLRPEWQQEVAQLKAQSGDPQAQDVQQDQWFNNKFQIAQMQFGQRLMLAQMKRDGQGQLTPGGLATLAVQHLFQGPAAFSRMDPETRKEVINFESEKGLLPSDGVAATAQIKGLYAAAGAVGRREGNIAILQNSIDGAGQQVLAGLGHVSRTSFTPFNAATASVKSLFSNPNEAAYASAVQTYVNEYARVVGGGNAITTDEARRHAMALLSTAQGPQAVKATLAQLGKETQIIGQAGDAALEMLAHPTKYSAIRKIQDKAGVSPIGFESEMGGGGSEIAAQQAPQQAAQPMEQQSKSGKPIVSMDGGKTWHYK